ncbi:MAG: NADP-dependent phosphogluconate dehydrogenase [Balneolaceae bacterium]|nr:NADP-dependent phosphogluconate dehydrogenase [Balneolaceae bacterium]
MSNRQSEIGVLGLGVMGAALTLNLADQSFRIAVYNRDSGREIGTVSNFLAGNASQTNILGFTDLKDFVSNLERPRKIIVMISASAVDAVLADLLPLLDADDIILDAGNSHFKETETRQALCSKSKIEFIGCGVSGGERGARFGPSIIPGGSPIAFSAVEPYLKSIAAKDKNGSPCMSYVGKGSAGHFVKMVHNGIEYVEMQLLAELYQLLRGSWSNERISELLESWNGGELHSYLLEITSNILIKKEGDSYLLDQILDKAGNKGTGSWSSISALELGSDNSMMSAAVFARYLSSQKETRVRLNLPNREKSDSEIEIPSLKNAYDAARRLNHLQGFELIRLASNEFSWDINFSELARIWTNGCIIRSALMEEVSERFKTAPSLLEDKEYISELGDLENALSESVQDFVQHRIASPAFSSSWNYWIGLTTANGSANLIQAQRDYFGAHTYQRVDDPNGAAHHTNWEE